MHSDNVNMLVFMSVGGPEDALRSKNTPPLGPGIYLSQYVFQKLHLMKFHDCGFFNPELKSGFQDLILAVFRNVLVKSDVFT